MEDPSMAVRHLLSVERQLAHSVFEDTVPYSRILVTDQLGLQNRAFMIYVGSGRQQQFLMNVGPTGYAGMQQTVRMKDLMIHEMTHAWQSVHSLWSASYIFSSLWAQAWQGRCAYDYVAGASWGSYNVEQQASIVEDWFHDGMSESDERFRYIRDNIRAGNHS
jgi:hypothetical protein